MWESPHLRFPRTVGRGGGRTVSLSCLPRFPSDRHFHRCFFCKSLKIDPNSLSQIQNTGTKPDVVRSRARLDSATKLRSSSMSALAICTKPATRVAGSVVDFWQDKLHVAHRNHDPSAQARKTMLQCNESP